MGAEYTPSQSIPTEICIAVTKEGPEAAQALEWGITILSHVWLEECFEQWRYIDPSSAGGRYFLYPPGTDYADILRQRGIGSTRKWNASYSRPSACRNHTFTCQCAPIAHETGGSSAVMGDDLFVKPSHTLTAGNALDVSLPSSWYRHPMKEMNK